MIYLLSIAFVLSVLIFVHELGHFLAAKLSGVRVERFSIGFPPRLFGIKIGETDYCISAIPFGGYVKLAGMVDESMDTTSIKGEPWEFNSKPLYAKVFILSAGVLMNYLLAVLIFGGVLWAEGEQIYPTTQIAEVAPASIGAQLGLQPMDRVVAVNGQPVHTWNEMVQQMVQHLDKGLQVTVQREGRSVELVLTPEKGALENNRQLGLRPLFPAVVGEVSPGYPAEQAGLQTGDRILAINQQPVADWEEMTRIVRAHPDQPLQMTVLRGTDTLQITITPKPVNEIGPDQSSQIVGKIGIGPYVQHRQIGLAPALAIGFKNSLFLSGMILRELYWLITGKKSVRDAVAGPVMITKMAGEFARAGFANLLMFTANLSLMLAILNIMPFPVLDGGHLVIVLVEGIRRKPISVKTKMAIQQVGMALLIMLMIFVVYNDLTKVFK